jgi:hypothetical protein
MSDYGDREKTLRLWTAIRNWRRLVQPNWPGNMTPHERELALIIDEIDNQDMRDRTLPPHGSSR